MNEIKKSAKTDVTSKKNEVSVSKKKKNTNVTPSRKVTTLPPATPLNLWQAFDNTFERFRDDFENLLFPQNWFDTFSITPQVRVPAVDLEDQEKQYMLKAEMPGFKKEDIEIEVEENSVIITGEAGWKYDKKEQEYICKERACQSFYRIVDLPEEVKVEEVTANLADGVLEITLPKKMQKQKRKVKVA